LKAKLTGFAGWTPDTSGGGLDRAQSGHTISRHEMIQEFPSSIPDPHRRFLSSSIDVLRSDARIVGVAVGGSFLTNSMDEFSDLDLVIAADPLQYDSIMVDRPRIASSLGSLLAAFTGEHVGEPRLLICLYDGPPLLHVDLKFLALPDITKRIEDPAILWERGGEFTRALEEGIAEYPILDLQWIEDRFWIWLHYTAAKIDRGEIFEALECLSFLRTVVLGPLVLLRSGARPAGVRKLERMAPNYVRDLQATVASYNAVDCVHALRACVEMYRSLRVNMATVEFRQDAEKATMLYLSDVEQRCGLTSGPT
jgi:hypothetical protein